MDEETKARLSTMTAMELVEMMQSYTGDSADILAHTAFVDNFTACDNILADLKAWHQVKALIPVAIEIADDKKKADPAPNADLKKRLLEKQKENNG